LLPANESCVDALNADPGRRADRGAELCDRINDHSRFPEVIDAAASTLLTRFALTVHGSSFFLFRPTGPG